MSYAVIELFLFVEDDPTLLPRAALDYACTPQELRQGDPRRRKTAPSPAQGHGDLARVVSAEPLLLGVLARAAVGDGLDELEVGEAGHPAQPPAAARHRRRLPLSSSSTGLRPRRPTPASAVARSPAPGDAQAGSWIA